MSSPHGGISSAHDDLYGLLNVPREATADDLKRSFRQLSQRYHPDKHTEDSAKKVATDQFTKVKEAYEILSNDKLRKLYNEFGLDAARTAATQDMELVPYSDLAERFRNEAGGSGSGNSNTPRDAYFTMINALEPQIDATGLVVALQDGDPLSEAVPAVFSQVGISTMATAYISQKNTLGARYAVRAESGMQRGRRRSGVGELALSLRRQIDTWMHAEGTAYVPLDEGRSTNYAFKVFRALSSNATASFEASFDPERRDLTTALTATRSFDERCVGSTSWAYGASPGCAFTWRRNAYDEYVAESVSGSAKAADDFGAGEDEEEPKNSVERVLACAKNFIDPIGIRCTTRLNVMDGSVRLVLRRPIGQQYPLFEKSEALGSGGASVKMRAEVTPYGWEVEMGGGRKYIMADTSWSTSVSVGTVGVVWRVKFTRSGHRLTIPIVLVSSVADPKVATVAGICTSLAVSAIHLFLVTPWRERQEREEREEAKARRMDILRSAKGEAEKAVELMRGTVDRCRKREEEVELDGKKGSGLLIERAVYGIRQSVVKLKYTDDIKDREIDIEVVDITDAVQALVEGSALQVVSRTKSTLPGFWDPSAFGDKEDLFVKVWYRFRGELHECLVPDAAPIELPLSSHRVQIWR